MSRPLWGSTELKPHILLFFEAYMPAALSWHFSGPLCRGCFYPWGAVHAGHRREDSARPLSSRGWWGPWLHPWWSPRPTCAAPDAPTRWLCLTPLSGCLGTRRAWGRARPQHLDGDRAPLSQGARNPWSPGSWNRQCGFCPLTPEGMRF